MARVKFVRNSAGYKEILNSEGVGAMLLARVERAVPAARASAPVDSGDYRDGIEAEVVTTDRKVGRVVAKAAHSLAVESRSRNLGGAIDAAGGG